MIAISASVFAANAPLEQETSTKEFGMETITVTAQRRQQNAQDVGIALSVIGQEELKARRIEGISDFVLFTANASVKENIPGLSPTVSIRGIGLNDFNATNNPSAGVYIDDVALSSLALLSTDLIDLERMEVLKGPQGTLYGRNSTAGALNVVTAKPDFDETYGMVNLGSSNFDTKEAEFFANLPLSDQFAIRVAGKQSKQDEGFYTNKVLGRDVGRRDDLTGRITVAWRPNENVNVLLKIEKKDVDSEIGSPEFIGFIPTATETNCPGQPGCADFFGFTDTDGDPFDVAASTAPDYTADHLETTARVEVDLGFATLTSVTGYIDFGRMYNGDVDYTSAPLLDFVTHDDVIQLSQEIRLSGENEQLSWQTGVYYSKDEVDVQYDGVLAIFNTTSLTQTHQESTAKAIFGQAEWFVNDEVSIITGLRYSDEDRANKGATKDLVSLAPGSALSPTTPVGSGPVTLASIDDEINETSWAWKLGINWKPLDDVLVYVSSSQGTKSGGFYSGVSLSDAQLQPYDKETLISYEAGIKGQLRGDAGFVRYSVGSFFYDYQNMQTFVVETGTGLGVPKLGNVDEAELYGLDLDLSFVPSAVENLALNIGAGYIKSELGTFVDGVGVVPKGNELPDAPKYTLNLGAVYSMYITDTITARVALDSRYQSDVYKDARNNPILEGESRWVSNARISLMNVGVWDVSLWAKNLTDEEVYNHGTLSAAFGSGSRLYAPPRTYGLSLTKHFN
ncbi:MAG: iron complex outermembrane receptor protein [Candidatus Azotimanducaceae bacterium]|jgi:iron complex outermembrane receptor protein